MYLGQMTTEKTSIQYYLKGIEIIKNQIQQTKVTENSEEGQNLKRKAADAYVSMTEIYLSDLCFEPDAEAKCEEYLKLAAEVDPNCPVVYQTLASVRMSQNNLEDAVLNLKKSVEMWQANPQLTPSYENRISLARLMIEAQLYDDCLTLLETLQREDDQYVDLWYLYGWIYYLVGSESQDKLEYFASAAECLEQALKVIKLGQYCDHDLASHCTQLLEEIYSLYPKDQLRKEIDDALPPSEESDMELN
ncbi:UPF0661 TPR repeat-containing protein [Zancudomyces culisetae]|uniref:UPF0661 TPR repeat-containing protein n=1 Tax=Zancudomyces culisetae TaxID=1213189 RepID=A0A1R1PCN1_ZANCU|nr:UPF0661 TPR repeat-containing protein [Zancudomyces culisetae]|eukprot:OMH78701.1 UPF0661 TPR repeat-containing protein [Zancudomyces culisetae]